MKLRKNMPGKTSERVATIASLAGGVVTMRIGTLSEVPRELVE